jgi:4-amino-4-deoxychorismate lyase
VTDRFEVSAAELFGDGVFETVHLRPTGPWLLDEHLDRLARSAALLELTLPPRADLEARVAAATAGWRGVEAALRIICTRESVHVTVSELAESVRLERRHGVRLISAGAGPRPPWSLSAAKSLSYASNFAARRWARRQGADDLVCLSTEGYVLEAPTASLVWLAGGTLCTVPADRAGILAGTTAAHLLSVAPRVGLRAEERMVTLAGLAAADAVWLASALRGLAEAVSLDGVARPGSPWTPRLRTLLGFPN